VDTKLWYTQQGSGSVFFLRDHLNSTRALVSSSGTIIPGSEIDYDSFGHSTAQIPTRYRYTGREYDPDTELYYYRARWYDPQARRFISEDPIGLNGGINLYAYVENNPMLLTDPYGLRPGDKYKNIECAGFDAVWDYNQTSKKVNREYGGWIYENMNDHTFSYVEAIQGGPAGIYISTFKPIPSGTKIVGYYHTHGAYDRAYNSPGNPDPGKPGYKWRLDGSEVFSSADKSVAQTYGTAFVGTPQGTTQVYYPKTNKDKVLSPDTKCKCR